MIMRKLTITRPDDCHIHLRDGLALATTVPDAACRFARVIVMPNTKPPITEVSQAQKYRENILAKVPQGLQFEPLMTLYLTDQMSTKTLSEAKNCGFIKACKLYPAGATTNSQSGVTELKKIYPLLEVMQELGLLLLIHGEVTDTCTDIFDREKIFIERELIPLLRYFPKLQVVLEHITTKDAVEFVKSAPHTLAATITAHHLLLNRNDLLLGGIHPHYYCLPVVKRSQHQEALIAAATSGNPKFFLGTDSAPHSQESKESACGCAGIYTAHAAIELYAEIFEKSNALKKLEGFASWFGADFYGLPRNEGKITLIKQEWAVPEKLSFAESHLIPFRSGEKVGWKIENQN